MKFFAIMFMLLTTFPVVAGTFRDDFGDGNLDRWEEIKIGDPLNWRLDGEQLVFTCGFNTAGRQVLSDVITDDVMVEFDAKMEEAFEHMVAIDCTLRSADNNHEISFNIGRWNNRLASAFFIWWNGKDEVWIEVPFPFENCLN